MIHVLWLTLLYFLDVSQSYEVSYYGPSYDNFPDYSPRHGQDQDNPYHGQSHDFDSIHHYKSHNNNMYRPCNVYNINCIRKYFTKRSRCVSVNGHAPDPYMAKSVRIILPSINATAAFNDNKFLGLNSGEIREFYVDKKSKTLVLEVVFDRIVMKTDTLLIQFYRNGEHPVDVDDFYIAEYRNISLTLTIVPWKDDFKIYSEHSSSDRKLHDLPIVNSHVYAHLTDKHPPLVEGQKLAEVKHQLNKEQVPASDRAKDQLVKLGEIFMAVFIQSKICDFRKI